MVMNTETNLTREYFSLHNWEIIEHKPDKDGFVLWEAKWNKLLEKGDSYYAELCVTNIMYTNRFCISGFTSKGFINLKIYTEKELLEVLKVIDIIKYYE